MAAKKGIKKSVTPAQVVELLNEALALDPEAICKFIGLRVRINKTLDEHPTIQTGKLEDDIYTLGPLGLLNGLFGIASDGCGCIAAIYEVGCRKGHTQDKFIPAGEPCPKCGNKLMLGKIIEFRVIRKPGD